MEPIALKLREIERSKNVDALLTEEQSNAIGADVVRAFDEDKQSRLEWEKRMDAAIKLALQMVEHKSTPWPNASNVKFPLITIAALQFAARAYPALIKGPDLVKYRVMGEDKTGEKAARAGRIGRHMSYQLLDQDEQWEEDTDRKFIVLPIIGCAFKKTYWDPLKKKNCSRLVLPQNLVVHYYTRSIEECERKTEIFELYEREIKEKQLNGLYSERELTPVAPKDPKLTDQRQGVSPPPVSKHTPRELLEQHLFLDLDGDGYPEPYIATVDRATHKVMRIVPRFGEVVTAQSLEIDKHTDAIKGLQLQIQALADAVPPPTGQEDDQAIAMAQQVVAQVEQIEAAIAMLGQQIERLKASNESEPQVLRISPLECYTKYGFIPSPDGGFYDLGLGALLGPLNDSVNTLINQLIDAGTLQNGSTGFIGKGARIQGGELRFKPNEWKRVNVAGQTLRDSIVPLPVNQPSLVLFQLLSLLITYSEKVSSVNDAMMGNNPGQNTPAFNMQAMLEQGLQVFNGIFKRIYRSFRKELRKLYVMNRIYLNPIEYFETMDGRFTALQGDYAGPDDDVMPAADPNAFSNQENMMKAQFLATRAATTPGYNLPAVERRLLESMDIPDVQDVYPVDEQGNPTIPPPPNPELQMQAAEEERRTAESRIRSENDTRRTIAEISEKEARLMLDFEKVKQSADKLLIDEYNAITARVKAEREALEKRVKASEAAA
jgi:chaperonin GroES